MFVDMSMYCFFVVILASSLVANIFLVGLTVRWKTYAKQYKNLWKEAIKRSISYDPYEKLEKDIKYEYLEGLD